MMNYTIFYSWQSDLENKFNRSFIQDVLEKATKNISKDENFNLDAVVDRDTYGIAGSPSIVESITGKIAKSDVFVCDISIINDSGKGRKTPNPNVLYELGFASAILGWERIIMIQNTAYGSIKDLPFDLRGRRILQYHLDSSIENRKEERNGLKTDLSNILKGALKHYSNEYIKKEKNIWWGKWKKESKQKMRGGNLHISRVASDSFFFDLSLYDGARSGEVYGKAQILTPNSAYARIETFENKNCEILFKRRLQNDSWYIEVEEGEYCKTFHGLSATFSGNYKHLTESLVDYGYLDEIDMNEVARMTGKYLSAFLDNFQQFGVAENLEGGDFKVVSAGVKGLYTIMEAIVITNKKGDLWCAFIDPEIDVIRYFSNNSFRTKTIENWIKRIGEKEIIENQNNNQYEKGEF
jgi:hypothetical protein